MWNSRKEMIGGQSAQIVNYGFTIWVIEKYNFIHFKIILDIQGLKFYMI